MEEKSFLSRMRGKVIAAFLLTCAAIGLALFTTYVSFDSLLIKVDELSAPNQKLKILNNLFEQITQLDQKQRADAIRNPRKPYRVFRQESQKLTATLDSLSQLSWEDGHQKERLQAMKRILAKRDHLLIEYLKLKSDFISDKTFSHRLDSLSDILVNIKPSADSSVTTHQTKTTTTTYLPEEKKRNFLNRLFSGKKQDPLPENRVAVTEEVNVKVDTLAIARQDNALLEIGNIMKRLDDNKEVQSREMMERELNLINTNIALINQLLSILQEVETEEMKLIENKNAEAASMVASSINRIGIIILIFFLLATILVFLILIDISKSNYYRLQLIKAKDEAEQLSQVKQRFLANMSHEIRTPLQSIIGFSEQLKNESHPEMLNAIQRSSEHLLHIVDEVLDFSRIESGKIILSKEPFHLEDLIEEITSVVRIQATDKNLTFIVNEPEIISPVLGDPFRLRQILYNLLSNAIKFTANGRIQFSCLIKNETETHLTCQFEITDTGKGIPVQDQERIFKQFEQGEGNINRQYGGSGLGLSIVKNLVDLLGGTIEVKSEIGMGSVFTIIINFEKNLSPTKIVNSYSMPVTYSGLVWVVDDDPLILKLCSIILGNNGIPHRTIQDPELVLKEDLSNVKIIFMDIRMPKINGVELCKQVKASAPHLQVIALTAHVLPQERASIMQSGFDRILTKPFLEQDLLNALGVSLPKQNEIDLTYLQKMTMGDSGLMNSIIEEFESETSKNLIDLEKRLLDQDSLGAREIIHQLAGRIGQFGARPLSNELKRIEQHLHAGVKLIELPELDLVIEQIRNFKKELVSSSAPVKSV
jgi:signal transduction histidine kinase/DNA-binding NarL/FixJ family response regulator